MNPESSAEYLQSVQLQGTIWNRYFFHQQDLELLHLTRRLASHGSGRLIAGSSNDNSHGHM